MLPKDPTEMNPEENPEQETTQASHEVNEVTEALDTSTEEVTPAVEEKDVSSEETSQQPPIQEPLAKSEAEAPAAETAPTPEEEAAPISEVVVEKTTEEASDKPEREVPAAETAPTPEEEAAPISEAVVEKTTEEASDKPEREVPAAETAPTPEEEAAPISEAVVEKTTEEASDKPEKEVPAAEAGPPTAQEPTPEKIHSELSAEEAAMAEISQKLNNPVEFEQMIAQAGPNELILMLDLCYKAEEVRPYIRKVSLIKQAFDKITNEQEVSKDVVERYTTAMSRFNKKRTAYQAELEQQKESNLSLKQEIVEKLKVIVEAEDMSRHTEVRGMQDAWNRIGPVPKNHTDQLIQDYRQLLDKYYQHREIHFQLLEYDRQINLKEKEKLLIELQDIIPPEDQHESREAWIEKNDLLTDIQLRWRATGHVPRKDVDRINEEYRKITQEFFNLRHEFYESQDQEREENAVKKRELLEQMQPYLEFSSEKPRAWNEATEKFRKLQEEWKEVGRAPQAVNAELWKQFRAVGNAFFGTKAEFFRKLDDIRSTNLEKKKELCERAEAIMNSTEWGKTARAFKELQAEWKKTGPVPERQSNKIWARFRAACDTFFEARRQQNDAQREDELINLKRKRELIEEVRQVSPTAAGSRDAAIQQIKQIQARWKDIGRVPFREKDVIWREFRAEIDQFFDDLRAGRNRSNYAAKGSRKKVSMEDSRTRGINGKITAIRRKMERSQTKIDQYSTNIEFISKGKSGDALRERIIKEIENEKKVVEKFRKEIRQLQDELKAIAQEADKKEAVKAEEKQPKAEAPAPEETDKKEAKKAKNEQPKAEAKAEDPAPEEVISEAEPQATASDQEEQDTPDAEASETPEEPAAETEPSEQTATSEQTDKSQEEEKSE